MLTFYINNSTTDKDFDCVCSFITNCNCRTCCAWKNSSIKKDNYYIQRINVKINYRITLDFCNNLNINLYFEYEEKLINQLSGPYIKQNKIYDIVDNELQFLIGDLNIVIGKNDEINSENLRIQNELKLIQMKAVSQFHQNIFDLQRDQINNICGTYRRW